MGLTSNDLANIAKNAFLHIESSHIEKQGPDLYSSAFRGISVAVLPLNHVISRRGDHISSIIVAVLSLNSEF